MTRRSLDDEVTVVTGASSGIGRSTALALAREGADVAVAARGADRLETVAEEIRESGSEALVVPTDVGEEAAVEALFDATVERFGRLDVVISNAGVMRGDRVEDFDTEDYRTMTRVNVDGAFYCARAAIPHLRETEGHLLFVGSFAGQYPRPFNPVYAGTKWWIEGFARSLAGQVGSEGVAVSTVRPAEVRTELGSEGGGEEGENEEPRGDGEDEEAGGGEAMKDRYEPGEAIEPDDVAEAILFSVTRSNVAIAGIDVYRRDKFSGF